MQTLLEVKYDLFESVDDMLAQQNLSKLLSKKIEKVQCYPMSGHGGLAGSHLSYVEADSHRLILKHLSLESDWIMFASADYLCRSVTVWQYGLLDRLTPYMDHAIVACSRDGDGWAILMCDLSHGLLGDMPRPVPMTSAIVHTFVDVLARLHATFWNDPILDNARLGLCDIANFTAIVGLGLTQHYPNFAGNVIPKWVVEGWEIMDAENFLEPDVKQILRRFIEYPQPLFDALSRYPFTLLHGDFRIDNVALPEPSKPAVFDWEAAARSLMTIDLMWFLNQQQVRQLTDCERLVDFYRARLERYLGQTFEDSQWRAMLDLGCLYHALRGTCFAAYWWKHTDNKASRAIEAAKLRERNQQVRDGVRWL